MDVSTIRQRLLARAFLYDSPGSYGAGVLDALTALGSQPETAGGPPNLWEPDEEERRTEREAVLRHSAGRPSA